MGDLLRRRVADNERQHLEGFQEHLQEGQLHFESMLGSVRGVGPSDKLQVVNRAQGVDVHGHTAKRRLESSIVRA
jgi:hypothetical protein